DSDVVIHLDTLLVALSQARRLGWPDDEILEVIGCGDIKISHAKRVVLSSRHEAACADSKRHIPLDGIWIAIRKPGHPKNPESPLTVGGIHPKALIEVPVDRPRTIFSWRGHALPGNVDPGGWINR